MVDFLAGLFAKDTFASRGTSPGVMPARPADYLFAVIAAGLATLLRLLLDPLLGNSYAFIISLLVVIGVAWQGGLGPALVSMLLGLLGAIYLFLPPRRSLVIHGLEHQLGVALYCFVGVACALLGEIQRTARRNILVSLQQQTLQRQALEEEVRQRRRVEEELRESTARLRALAEVVPQIVWQTSPEGHHDYFNQRWYDLTGLAPEQSLGFGWLAALHPDDRDEARQRWQEATQTGKAYEIEYRFRGKDDRFRWFLGRALPYRDPSGRILCWFGTCTDIDDQKREKETLEQLVRERTVELTSANEALRRSNQELEQFAYVASHDLQEPLRKIQAFGDRLQTRCAPELGEQGLDYLGRVLASATRMRRLIDDLLTFSRVSTRPQAPAVVDLGVIAREVVSDLDGTLQQTGGQVEIGALPTLEADPLQMRQLLQNLIGNGLKFHRPDVPPLVRVQGRLLEAADLAAAGLDPERTWYEIAVADNGIGFDEVYLDRIFQVFQRLHGRTEYAGTGVGLAICRKIAERHGGQITARAQPGQGSTFLVCLPGGAAVDDKPGGLQQ